MKTLIALAFFLAAVLVVPGAALAQHHQAALVQSHGRFADEYLQNPAAKRSGEWWKALNKEVNLSARSYTDVKESDLQRVILFATLHGEDVDLGASVLSLVNVYRYHDDLSMRILALSALSRIGDASGLAELRKSAAEVNSPRLRRLTTLVLQAHGDIAVK